MSSVAPSSPFRNQTSGPGVSEGIRSEKKLMDLMKISCSTKKSESPSFTNISENLQQYQMTIINVQSQRINKSIQNKTIWWLLKSFQSLRSLQIKQKLLMLDIGIELIIRYLRNHGQNHKELDYKTLGISTSIFLLKVLWDGAHYLVQESEESIYCTMGLPNEQYWPLEEIQIQMMDYFIDIKLETTLINSLKQESTNTIKLVQSMQFIINFIMLSFTDELSSVAITYYDEIRLILLRLLRLRNQEKKKDPLFAQFEKALKYNEKIVIHL